MTTLSATRRLNLGILGGRGMLGSDLTSFLSHYYEVTPIDKENYDLYRGKSFDIFINANGNSRRFWANQNPGADFEANVLSVSRSFDDFNVGIYIYISSSDVYLQHSSPATTQEDMLLEYSSLYPYGFDKALGELIVKNRAKRWLVLRMSMILGSQLRKGPVFDILQGTPLFVSPKSRLQLISTQAVAQIILTLLDRQTEGEILNVGGRGTVSIAEMAQILGKSPVFSDKTELQEYEMNIKKLSAYFPVASSREYLQKMAMAYYLPTAN